MQGKDKVNIKPRLWLTLRRIYGIDCVFVSTAVVLNENFSSFELNFLNGANAENGWCIIGAFDSVCIVAVIKVHTHGAPDRNEKQEKPNEIVL